MRCLGWTALAAFALAGSVAFAEQAGGEKDFTFKRVKVGGGLPGGKRILVQIDPVEQKRMLALNPAVPLRPEVPHDVKRGADSPVEAMGEAEKDVPSSNYAWFWNLISPHLSDSRSGRMETAVAALRNGPSGASVKAPRLSHLQAIADEHGAEILKATIGTKVSPALVLAVIGIESSGRTAAVSSAGATGLMQLMPATAERFGVKDRTDAVQNIRGGVAYLDWLLKHFDRDPIMALAGYNAGENAVRANAGVPPYAETRDYVPKVIAAWNVAKGLCLTQPQLVSDGCVFRRGMQTAQVVDKP
ncbi:lytic transglycosylase domain-containing protein [Aliiruegeria lutimaris]|uniref:Transglycosylase SLT domain-containing protein n=1 Tax=Aliiruegeria lutimaris TaxID=571298 RepID=A0A1G8ZBU7_9RHOB|nr:lytic transglycosylase domain-containing protein [Aliiruegeria lutimaris]SDK11630.1 Transglycosylase SLT domain-containing protein [Aliiruegeria lutimaris]